MANEKRLIDANALMEAAYDSDEKQGNDVWHTGDIEYLVMAQPTVDAVEVVHGHWVSLTECSNAGVYCSVCNKKVYKEDYAWCNRKNKLRSNYCPNCGARMMDGGNEDV